MKIHNIEQQGDEWFALHDLRLTSSEATAIGNNGAGLKSLVKRKVAEHFSSGERKNFSSFHTDRGNELEPVAREIYELETGHKIDIVGFVETGKYTGCSPDGMISTTALVEFKCPDDIGYFKVLMENEVDSDYMWQVQYQLLLTERKYCDLVYYNPNFKKNMVVFRIYPDQEKQEKLRKGIEMGTQLIEEQLSLYEERIKETGPKIIGAEPEDELVMVYEGRKPTGSITLQKIPNLKKK